MPRYAGLSTFAGCPGARTSRTTTSRSSGFPLTLASRTARGPIRAGPRFSVVAATAAVQSVSSRRAFRFQQVVDAGDIACNPFDLVEAIGQIEAGCALAYGSGPRSRVPRWGSHERLPLLRAMKKVHGPVALVHFDAHLDTWPTYFGAPYTHGTPFRRAGEEGLSMPGQECTCRYSWIALRNK